jgi:hypothetical protein
MSLQKWDNQRGAGTEWCALELWAESRERVADELCERADCLARLGLAAEAATDCHVSLRFAGPGSERPGQSNELVALTRSRVSSPGCCMWYDTFRIAGEGSNDGPSFWDW